MHHFHMKDFNRPLHCYEMKELNNEIVVKILKTVPQLYQRFNQIKKKIREN